MNQNGFDTIIITTSSAQQRSYWSRRLKYTLPTLFTKQPKIIVIEEIWEGGAGNGLGTLYALKTAMERDEELFSDLEKGASIGVFHTAGLGKQMQPLVGSERNNKAALILPGQAMQFNLTMLEAVIKQALPYAFPQRITVFYDDQLFLSSEAIKAPTAHVELYTIFKDAPDKEGWKEKKLQRYGVVTRNPDGRWQFFDKIRFAVYDKLASKGVIDPAQKIGCSVGAFSMSSHFANLLLTEFNPEINKRNDRLNAGEHFWMPALLDKKVYSAICGEESLPHYERMQNLLKRVNTNRMPFFNAQNIGEQSYWWDMSTLQNYYTNLRKLLEKTPESSAFKELFGIKESQNSSGVHADKNSLLLNCKINGGTVRNSILINVVAEEVHCSDSVLIDVLSPQIESKHALLYHCTNRQSVHMGKEGVRCDVFDPQTKSFKAIKSTLKRDGKEDWEEKIENNPYSYAELYELNRSLSMEKAEIIWFKERQEIAHDILKVGDANPGLA